MNQSPSFDMATARAVRDAARLLVTYRATDRVRKRHGSADSFVDDVVRISTDTWNRYIMVKLMDGTLVLEHETEFTAFRPGPWIDHVSALAQQVRAVQAAERELRDMRIAASKRERFAPLDEEGA
jgi:hypothetical protein